MEPWRSVHLTRAHQVGELMALRRAEMPGADVPLRDHYEALRVADPSRALAYIGHALPRREALHWAAGLIDAGAHQAGSPEAATFERAQAWLGDPDDAKRRAAYAAAQDADPGAPERALATAIFYAGGSIAPEDAAPVQPAPGLANQLAVVAVEQAAYRSADPQAFFARALEAAETIADQGISPQS